MTRRSASFRRHADATLRADVAAGLAALDAKRAAIRELSAAARRAEASRVYLTHDDLVGATHVRTRWGWFPVVTLHEKSVTIPDPLSSGGLGTERVPFHRIYEART